MVDCKLITSIDVIEDEYGNKMAAIESKTTKGPKGLFNKTQPVQESAGRTGVLIRRLPIPNTKGTFCVA